MEKKAGLLADLVKMAAKQRPFSGESQDCPLSMSFPEPQERRPPLASGKLLSDALKDFVRESRILQGTS